MAKAKTPVFPLNEKQVNDMVTAMLIACRFYLDNPEQYHTDQLSDDLWSDLQREVLPAGVLAKLSAYETFIGTHPCPEIKWLWFQAEVFVFGTTFDGYESGNHNSDSFAEFVLLDSPIDLMELLSVTLPFLERNITSITHGDEVILSRKIISRITEEHMALASPW